MDSPNTQYELNIQKAIARFGREKCLEAYDIASKYIPLEPNRKYQTWQEQVSVEMNVNEDEAMDLWAAGNSIIGEKHYNQNKEIIEKFGEAKIKEIYEAAHRIMASGKNWRKSIPETYNVTESDVMDIFLAGLSIKMKETAPQTVESVKSYHRNRDKLHSCPKKECGGKLHKTTAISEEYNGLYICDTCSTSFKKK